MKNNNDSTIRLLDNTGKVIILFIVLNHICTVLLGMTLNYINNDFLDAYRGYLCMYCPCIAGLITSRFYKEPTFRLGLKMCSAKYLILGITIPICYLLASYSIYWVLFPEYFLPDFPSLKMLCVVLPIDIFFAFGEEIGWRGFLAHAMTSKFGYIKASIFVGLIWGVWHSPSSLNRLYYPGGAYLFITSTILLSFIMIYLRLKSKSVWPAVAVHAIHNYLQVSVLDPITVGSQEVYYLGEAGVITLGVTAIIAIGVICVQKKHPLETTPDIQHSN